jgi:ComEC/Rec2-related protein
MIFCFSYPLLHNDVAVQYMFLGYSYALVFSIHIGTKIRYIGVCTALFVCLLNFIPKKEKYIHKNDNIERIDIRQEILIWAKVISDSNYDADGNQICEVEILKTAKALNNFNSRTAYFKNHKKYYKNGSFLKIKANVKTVSRNLSDLKSTELKDYKVIDFRDSIINQKRKGVINAVGINDQSKSFMSAFIFGDKSKLTKTDINNFKLSGTLHIFAVSGLHIGCLFLLLTILIKMFKIPDIFQKIIVLCILFFFLFLVDFSVSSVRAYTMITVWVVASSAGLRTNNMSSLCVAFIITILTTPDNFESVGFLLSISVVTSIIWLNGTGIDKGFKKRNFLQTTILLNYSAFWGSFLIIAHSFSMIVPSSLFSNLLLIPMVSFIMPFSIFILILSLICKIEFLNLLYDWIINLLFIFCEMIANLPFSHFSIEPGTTIVYIKYYFFIGTLLCSYNYFKNLHTRLLLLPLIVILIFSF